MAADKNGKELPKGIMLRGDGRYIGRFVYQGEKYTLYDRELKVLKKKMADLKYEVEHGIYAKEENVILASWFNIWITEYKMNSVKFGTIGSYTDCFNQWIKPTLGNKKLKEIRGEHIQKLYNDMVKAEYARTTIELVSVVLNSIYKQAIKNGMVQRNPVSLATLPRNTKKKEQRVLSTEEQKIFMKYAEVNPYFNVFKIALFTGMRSGELRALEWKDIDFKEGTISVSGTLKFIKGKGYFKDAPKTKTSERDIPMLEGVIQLLKKIKIYQAEQRLKLGDKWKPQKGLEHLVFTAEFGEPVSHSALNVEVKKIVARINQSDIDFTHMTPHALRHTFATRGIEKGIPPKVMQEILGHSSLSMTMDLYAHVLPDTKANEIKKIASLF